jgi:hypothetical protein
MAQQQHTHRMRSVALLPIGFLWLLTVCGTGLLFLGGCTQPNDPLPSDTPAQMEDTDQSEETKPEDVPAQQDTADQPAPPAQPDTPVQTETPAQSEEPAQPEEPSQPEEPDQPAPPAQAEEPVLEGINGVAALGSYLAALPENTEDTPYPVKVNGIDLETTKSSGDTLRTLYDALSRYVALDLSDCTGEALPNVTVKTAPNKVYLVSLTLPDTVMTIAINAFSGCTALTSVNMPKVSTIIRGAFSNLAKLSSVSMPEVQSIETSKTTTSGVFYKCIALTSVSLPKVTSIGDNAFYGCTELESLTLGATPPVLEGEQVFKNASRLSAIYVPPAALSSYASTDKDNWTSDLKEKVQALP